MRPLRVRFTAQPFIVETCLRPLAIPPAAPSREHVFQDEFGGRLALPRGAVCIACENRLKVEIDQPFRIVFQSLPSFSGVHATAVNAAGMCDARLADLDVDLTFAKLGTAHGRNSNLTAALTDVASVLVRDCTPETCMEPT